jgi:hypothetical protein
MVSFEFEEVSKNIEGKERAYCRKNEDALKNQDNAFTDDMTTLYVGGSQDIKNRIKQHLEFGAKKTYSLDMKTWISVF